MSEASVKFEGLTDEADEDEEDCTERPGLDSVGAKKRGEILCECGDADAKEGTEDVKASELELLCEGLLDGEHKLLEGEDEECILASEA